MTNTATLSHNGSARRSPSAAARLVLAIVGLGSIAGCGGGDLTQADSATSVPGSDGAAPTAPVVIIPSTVPELPTAVTDSAASSAPTAPAAPSTSAAPPPPPPTAPPTTEAPVPDGGTAADNLLLGATAIGGAGLGDNETDATDYMTAWLGAATSTTTKAFSPVGELNETDDGEFGFAYQAGTETCWGELCVYFGGAPETPLAMVGWVYAGDGAGLHTADGIKITSRVSEHDSIVVDSGGCYTVGGGTSNGIRLTLQTTGDTPFISVDDTGAWIEETPSRADIEVLSMSAGDNFVFLFGDC